MLKILTLIKKMVYAAYSQGVLIMMINKVKELSQKFGDSIFFSETVARAISSAGLRFAPAHELPLQNRCQRGICQIVGNKLHAFKGGFLKFRSMIQPHNMDPAGYEIKRGAGI